MCSHETLTTSSPQMNKTPQASLADRLLRSSCACGEKTNNTNKKNAGDLTLKGCRQSYYHLSFDEVACPSCKCAHASFYLSQFRGQEKNSTAKNLQTR